MKRPTTLVLFSGGLDSAVLLAWAKRRGPVATLTADYAGRPAGERRAERALLRHFRITQRHRCAFPATHSSWVDGSADRSFIPGRNLLLHANAFSLARRLGYEAVAVGHLRTDGDEFPDARGEFLRAFARLWRLGDPDPRRAPRLLLPFIRGTKQDVVALGRRMGVPFEKSWSCHRDRQGPCGRCEACRERERALTVT